jgi:hypothetical protein
MSRGERSRRGVRTKTGSPGGSHMRNTFRATRGRRKDELAERPRDEGLFVQGARDWRALKRVCAAAAGLPTRSQLGGVLDEAAHYILT